MADEYSALADPTRRAILRLLAGRELPAGDIAAAFTQQRPAISKHLAVLRRAGIVTETRNRQQRVYELRPGAIDGMIGFLAALKGGGIRQQDLGKVHRKSAEALQRNPEPLRTSVLPPAAERRVRQPAFDLDFD